MKIGKELQNAEYRGFAASIVELSTAVNNQHKNI